MKRASSLFLIALLAVAVAATGAQAAKKKLSGNYKGTATSTDGSAKYGASNFKLSKGKLVSWTVTVVPQDCGVRQEKMNYGFTVASNVLQAYGLKSKDVKLSSKNRLKFTYSQPSHKDKITVDVKFGKSSATGKVTQVAADGEKNTQNCSGSAKFKLKK
jgi:hypothetical protein